MDTKENNNLEKVFRRILASDIKKQNLTDAEVTHMTKYPKIMNKVDPDCETKTIKEQFDALFEETERSKYKFRKITHDDVKDLDKYELSDLNQRKDLWWRIDPDNKEESIMDQLYIACYEDQIEQEEQMANEEAEFQQELVEACKVQ